MEARYLEQSRLVVDVLPFVAQEEQKFAQMLLDDLASGSVTLEPGLTIYDYINQYKTKTLSKDIELAVQAFGLNKELLVDLLSMGPITEKNINDFGRYDRLLESVDAQKAKAYLESAMKTKLNVFQYNIQLDKVLRKFLRSGGKGAAIPKVEISAGQDEMPVILALQSVDAPEETDWTGRMAAFEDTEG